MPYYVVLRQEVWVHGVSVEAKDEAEAKELVRKGAGDETGLFEYKYTIAPENWEVEYDGEGDE